MEAVPEYRIRSGRMHIIWPELEIVLPVHTMLAGMAGAKREIDDWRVEQADNVENIADWRDHAASS
jgi:hypothetical protein